MKKQKSKGKTPTTDMNEALSLTPACHAAMILAARVKLIILEMEAAKALMAEEDFKDWTFHEVLDGLLDAEMYLSGYFMNNYDVAKKTTGKLGRMLAGK